MKKKNWLAFALMALLAPALAGCKFKCDDAKGVKNDILRIQEIMDSAIQDPQVWNFSCGELLARAARLDTHRRKLDQLADSRSCRRSDYCAEVTTLSNNIGNLQVSVRSICAEVQQGVANLANFENSSRGRALTFRARRAVQLIQNAIVPPGTVMLNQVCGEDELFANLSAPSNYANASVYSGNASRLEEEQFDGEEEAEEGEIARAGSASAE